MAVVLEALASYVTNMLTEMAKEEVGMLIGVSGEIDKLGVKLRDLKHFLADADRKNITDESVRGWVDELKRAMYLATDILDLCQLKAMEKTPSKGMGCFNPLLFCMRNPLHAHDIGTRIKVLNQTLDDICKRGGSFNFIKLETYQDRKMNRSFATDRKTDSLIERSGAVGEKIEDDTRALVEVLTKEVPSDKSDHLMVVAIVGVGGIGKTMLAKKVFNDEAMEGKFAKKIWLSITRDFNDVDLLSAAIAAAGGDMPAGGLARDKSLLIVVLRNAIRDKKLFLVLDDMWGVDAWEKLLMVPFSYGGPGSRVLITTRQETVCRSMKAVHHHHVDKLGPDDAWSLLKKQVLTSEGDEPQVCTLKDIGLQIIEKCDGLPLAIKVMGGLLCQKEKTRRDWEDVLNDDIWSVSRIPDELNYAIYLSYEDLPPSIKQCFLHFSLIPKKAELIVNEVVSMWIGEGLVHGDSYSLEEEGIRYYKELILRNLIDPNIEYPGQFICSMHDVICSFAQFVARDEALVARRGDIVKNKLRSHSYVRLSIETGGVQSDTFEWRYLSEQKSLRTLILTGSFKVQTSDSLLTFSSLRTLHIESAELGGLVDSVHQLKHLRYLVLKGCIGIYRLPESIYEMKFLQHISVEDCEGFVKLPGSIVKIQELRHLNIDGTHVNRIPSGFRALTNLVAIYGFPSYTDGDWCSLEELGPLFQLRELGLKGLENVSATSSVAKARLGAKAQLTRLVLECNNMVVKEVSEEEGRTIEVVFDELCPLPCLEYLSINGYFGRHLPRWMMSTTTTPLSGLRIVHLNDLTWCSQLPDGLCQLPCLEFLKIESARAIKHIGQEFVHPYNHHDHASSQAAAAFPRLKKLYLEGMVQWEEWEWEKEVHAMPALDNLLILGGKLRCIPPGLAFHARSLKTIIIWSVKGLHSVENFASVVELELYDIPYLTRISNFPKLQKLAISYCPKLELLQEMTTLRRLSVRIFKREEHLPLYLQTVDPSHLLLERCNPKLLTSMAAGKSGSEWVKFNHIQHVEAYADDGDNEKKWHLIYTSKPYHMETNIILESLKMSSRDEVEEGVEHNQDKMAH
ncbi:putative disease resistance protein RGA1 [Lolium rigidum]|uniref:putative disease resistance protein RGA1 n=1 Tax=Lolium rigidum TaxID=89674 RepID=UPI001F5C945F|nr:putative disease resistance protein RGA1 [Lolium rigidum]